MFLCITAAAQTGKDKARPADSLATTKVDTISIKKDSLKIKTKKDITTTIKYTAKDSLRMDVKKKLVFMYGKADIIYDDIALQSELVNINWATNEMRAEGKRDSTGKLRGVPVFTQGSEKYTAEQIRYNFKTKKGLISSLVTQQGEGYIHGEHVKRKDNNLYIDHAKYTTCNLAHPHFYINATKLKVIPDKKIVAGPFNFVFADIKTPIGFFLGFFPVPKKNKSGLIFPTYGSNQTQGFFLTRGGYYWAVNDYVGTQLTADIYTLGTWGLHNTTNYRKRYRYNGIFNVDFFDNKTEQGLEMLSAKNYRLTWNHSTDSKRSSSLSASVNIASASYNKLNSYNATTRFSNDFRSNVNYRKTFTGTPFSMTATLSQSQNVNTKLMAVTFPELFFSMNRIFPFKAKGSLGRAWYEQVAVQYNLSTKMSFDNGFYRKSSTNALNRVDSGLVISNLDNLSYLFTGGEYIKRGDSLFANNQFNTGERVVLNGAQYGAKHTLPISTSFKILKFFSLNPSITYSEYWFPRHEQYAPSDTVGKYTSTTVQGFDRAWSWSTGGTSLRTNIYGTYLFKKSKLMGIRHMMTPSLSYTYTPDLTDDIYSSYQQITKTNGEALLDANGNVVRVSKFNKYSSLYGSPNGRASSSIGFDLMNMLEAKVRTKDTANPTKKVKILDNLSLGGRYDLLADSFNLSVIVLNARTNIKDGRINISFNSAFDPYIYEIDTKYKADKFGNYRYNRRPTLAYNTDNNSWLSMTNASLTANTSLNPAAFKKATSKTKTTTANQDQQNYIKANQDQYVDFNVPWNMNISYQINFVGKHFLYGQSTPGNIVTNSMSLNGDVSLTQKWKITYNTSYDLKRKMLPMLSVGIIRDLHCWSMSMNIARYGNITTFLFNINAKSSLLQDLKLTKRSPGLLNTAGF